MVNRLIEPTSGRILLDGVDVADARRHRAPARDRLRDPAGRAVPAPDDRRERRHGRRACSAGRRRAAGAGRGAARARRPGPGALRRPLSAPAVRRRATARRRRPGARRRPAGDAHGRAVRRGRPDRPRAAPERVPPAPGAAGQDDPVRDPRHRRGDQDGRPRRGHAGRAASSRSSRPPAEILAGPGVGRSSPGSSARTAASSASRSRGSATCSCAARSTARVGDDAGDARGARSRTAFPYLLLVDADDRPLGWLDERRIPRTAASTPPWSSRRRRCSTGGRRSRTRCRCCSTATSRPGSSSTGPAGARGLVTVEQIAAYMRDTAREAPAAQRYGRGDRCGRRWTTNRGLTAGEPAP